MSEWLVACPDCSTRFRVLAGQLEVADGRVRCGACLAVFRASDRLEPIDAAPPSPGSSEEASRSHRHRSVLGVQPTLPEVPEPLPEGDFHPPPAFELPLTPILQAQVAVPRRRWPWVLIAVGGLLLAAVQMVFWTFDDGALDPRWRPYYATACAWIGCSLPELRDPASIRSLRLSIRPHPERANALLLEAMIENQAEFAQPYPAIELQFADIRGQPLAARRFRPDEYLRGEVPVGSLMPVGQSVRIALAMESPGDEAVNYQIRFW
ncbi:MAG: zinc-ribbon and DUF3426 domain-containing protein [Gammaproteobacteria bacterium]|nr:zinc-ribbon and DUF3426 domain-containing protein [Gammaproteobacteria bacterium]